jgi:HEAT repeat protein
VKKRLLVGLGLVALAVLIVLLVKPSPPEARVYLGKSIEAWARQCSAPEPLARSEGLAAFIALGSNAVPGLVRLLDARDSFVRKEVWALAPKLPGPIRQLVLSRVHPPDALLVRRGAAQGLAAIGPEAQAAAPALGQALFSGDLDLRWEAGRALGRLGKPAVPELVRGLAAPNPHVRYCAVSGLSLLGPDALAAAPALLKTLEDKDDMVRLPAANCFARLGTNVVPFLTNAMTSADPALRQRAIRGLGLVRPPRRQLVSLLPEMLRDKEPACRLQAVRVLGGLSLPNREIVSLCLGALDDPAWEVQVAAVQALAQARFHVAMLVPKLTERLSDESPRVREAAAGLLGAFGPSSKLASAKLGELLQDKDESVRAAATQALARLQPLTSTNATAAPK